MSLTQLDLVYFSSLTEIPQPGSFLASFLSCDSKFTLTFMVTQSFTEMQTLIDTFWHPLASLHSSLLVIYGYLVYFIFLATNPSVINICVNTLFWLLLFQLLATPTSPETYFTWDDPTGCAKPSHCPPCFLSVSLLSFPTSSCKQMHTESWPKQLKKCHKIRKRDNARLKLYEASKTMCWQQTYYLSLFAVVFCGSACSVIL